MKIVHVIDSLIVGGTENQFLALLPELARDHEIVLVTLWENERPNLGELPVTRRYRLRFASGRSLPRAVLELRRIIATEKPDLVRAQLYWSSVTARLATPRTVPLIFSVHSTMSADGYNRRRSALWLEKLSYSRRHMLLGVSRHVLNDFDDHVGIKGRAERLPNFVRPGFAENRRQKRPFAPPFRLIAVGNLKEVKNYPFLLQAIEKLPKDVTLDVYGEGRLRPMLQREIATKGLQVQLRGARNDMWNVLPAYDLFVMPSLHEGCPNAAIEAMAVGLPLLLSNIPPMHEVSLGNALFFDPHDLTSLVGLMNRIRAGAIDLETMAARGIELVNKHYLKGAYVKQLNRIYAEAVASADKGGDRSPQ
jgi:glycosyltransferase involved in cell wall biosynthesis